MNTLKAHSSLDPHLPDLNNAIHSAHDNQSLPSIPGILNPCASRIDDSFLFSPLHLANYLSSPQVHHIEPILSPADHPSPIGTSEERPSLIRPLRIHLVGVDGSKAGVPDVDASSAPDTHDGSSILTQLQ